MLSDSAHMAYAFLPEPPPPLHPPQSFGCMDLDLGRFDEALGLLTPALEMFQRLSTGRGEPDEAKCMYCVASCLYNQVCEGRHVTPATTGSCFSDSYCRLQTAHLRMKGYTMP